MRTLELSLDAHYELLMEGAAALLAAARTQGKTTLAAPAAAGATQITVAATQNLTAGDIIQIAAGAVTEIVRVESVGPGSALVLQAPLRFDHGIGESVQGALADVTGVARGDRTEAATVRPPVLWLMEGVDRIESSGGRATVHSFEVIVAALVTNNNPAAGRRAAADLAARAYNVLLADRTWGDTAHQVVPVRFEPAQRMAGNNLAFWAAVIFTAQARRRD